MSNIIEFSRRLGAAFASELNTTPNEKQNWSALDRSDDLPEFDYIAMRDENGGEVTPEMEEAYRDGFNGVFDPL